MGPFGIQVYKGPQNGTLRAFTGESFLSHGSSPFIRAVLSNLEEPLGESLL